MPAAAGHGQRGPTGSLADPADGGLEQEPIEGKWSGASCEAHHPCRIISITTAKQGFYGTWYGGYCQICPCPPSSLLFLKRMRSVLSAAKYVVHQSTVTFSGIHCSRKAPSSGHDRAQIKNLETVSASMHMLMQHWQPAISVPELQSLLHGAVGGGIELFGHQQSLWLHTCLPDILISVQCPAAACTNVFCKWE